MCSVPGHIAPKVRSSTFISLYFSTIGLGKQIISTKVVFQYNSLFSYLLCHLLTRIFDLCTSAPKVLVQEYFFQPHIFKYLIARNARTPSLFL